MLKPISNKAKVNRSKLRAEVMSTEQIHADKELREAIKTSVRNEFKDAEFLNPDNTAEGLAESLVHPKEAKGRHHLVLHDGGRLVGVVFSVENEPPKESEDVTQHIAKPGWFLARKRYARRLANELRDHYVSKGYHGASNYAGTVKGAEFFERLGCYKKAENHYIYFFH